MAHGGGSEADQDSWLRDAPADTPPTDSLASLSLDTPAPTSLPPPVPLITPVAAADPPKNKLAAKMAANRAAKAAAAAAAAAPPPPLPSTDASPAAAAPEKKLSKLQQKMLAAKSGRSTPSSALPAIPPPTAPEPSPFPPSDEAMSLDIPTSPLFSSPALLAAPSPFASVLAPSTRPFLQPVAQRIAGSLSVAEAVEKAKVGLFGLSPDDRVLEARRGTSLAAGVAVKRR